MGIVYSEERLFRDYMPWQEVSIVKWRKEKELKR